MSSSIEERANKYVEKHRSVETCYFTPAGSYSYHAERVAYAVGATEQRKIDIICVYQFLTREAAYNGSMSCIDDLLIEEVCKVLEEES